MPNLYGSFDKNRKIPFLSSFDFCVHTESEEHLCRICELHSLRPSARPRGLLNSLEKDVGLVCQVHFQLKNLLMPDRRATGLDPEIRAAQLAAELQML